MLARKVLSPATPKLLVSVRNVAEASAAGRGRCDILDIKEPLQGALGMASIEVMAAILQTVSDECLAIPVSAALGEVLEWEGIREMPQLPPGLAFVKLGCAGLAERNAGSAIWINVRRSFEQAGDVHADWIAVAYADWLEAAAPAPEAVIDMAIAARYSGVLFDTYRKSGKRLHDWLSAAKLAQLAARVRQGGLTFALAGSLQIDDVPKLRALQADILGIRGAACRGGRREAEICDCLVREFKRAIQMATSRSPDVTRTNL